tara:strand:- start:61 stop:282 length:222 start_codon:yes stop_codon:yes gene_type:complete
MKIKLIVKETVWNELIVDTDDFQLNANSPSEEVFEIAELINEIKAEPQKLFNQYEDEVKTEKEQIKVTVEHVE